MAIPTAETVAHVKTEAAARGTQAIRRRSRARTMEGFSIWIHLNWREDQTPIRKFVLAHRKAARTARGMELNAEKREELKKKAIWAAMRENQTPKKAPGLKLRESRM